MAKILFSGEELAISATRRTEKLHFVSCLAHLLLSLLENKVQILVAWVIMKENEKKLMLIF